MSKQKWQATKPDGKCFDTNFSIDFEGSCWSTCMAPIVDENENTVALIVDVNDHLTRNEFNGRMHLIAAAPELLAALEEVVRISDRKHDAWDAAHAAIAKAKGGQS